MLSFKKSFTAPIYFNVAFLASALFSGCVPHILSAAGVSSLLATSLTATSIGSGGGTSVTFTAPSGSAYSSVTVDLGLGFEANNICAQEIIFGLPGTASCSTMESNAFRNVGSAQLTQGQEVSTYASSLLPANYRDIPDTTKDDDGYYNADAGCSSGCTSVTSISWLQHIGMSTCGTSQNTLAARIADCLSQNPTVATWNGASNGNSGEGLWYLVTRNTPQGVCSATLNSCRPVEIWQDAHTGLIWSSLVSGSSASTGGGQATDNWCRAAGSDQSTSLGWPASDPSGYCNSGSYQNQTTPTSYCAETATYGPALSPALATENWSTGVYDLAKGGMGAISSASQPSVRWRLPTIHDYNIAEADGIRHVMPDMGAMSSGYEWSASLNSNDRNYAWIFYSYAGNVISYYRTNSSSVRCVGR